MHKVILSLLIASLTACSSGSQSGKSTAQSADTVAEAPIASHPEFAGDSAFGFVASQVAFGPRVPGSEGHAKCSKWIVETLQGFGADTVEVQRAEVTAFDGTRLPIANILGRFNTSAPRRVLLAAHYDTRPWADQDEDASRRTSPIDGANDGASGVAVLLEIARAINQQRPDIGVDMLFTDAEDYGDSNSTSEDSWCLGTQYWVDHFPYTPANRPEYGILLDMVGGRNARFHREYSSDRLAPAIVDKVWGTAAAGPYADRFPNQRGGAIVDDHVYINSAGIPCIDIIESANAQSGGFPPTWHTHNDNIDNIDPATLKAVGSVVLDVIYSEQSNK